MVLVKCKKCGAQYWAVYQRPVFLCRNCLSQKYYHKNKEKIIQINRKWEKANPEKVKLIRKKAMAKFLTDKTRYNLLMARYYLKHRKKCLCRAKTLRVIKTYPIPLQVCKICRSNNKLQIHHEIYPPTCREIRKAIDKGLIYYLCLDCHKQTRKRESDF